MIQRIQTIYMAISVIANALTLVFTFSIYSIGGKSYEFDGLGFEYPKVDFFLFPIIGNVIVSMVLGIAIIFSFKKRKTQLTLSRINFIVITLLIVFIFINFHFIESNFNLLKEDITYGLGFLLPILALVAQMLASRAIRFDEKLIKSMDRIR